jgi:hypothetical protein
VADISHVVATEFVADSDIQSIGCNLLPRLVLALPNPLLCALLLLLEPGLLWHPVGWVAPPRPRSDSSSAPSDFPPSPVSTAGASLRWNFENAESPSGS